MFGVIFRVKRVTFRRGKRAMKACALHTIAIVEVSFNRRCHGAVGVMAP